MAKIKKGLSLNGNSTGGKKKGFYFPEKDLELIEFLENQPESASKIIVRLVREYKNSLENQPQQTSNDQIMNIVNSNQEQLLQELGKIKEMLYYRPVIINGATNQFTPTFSSQSNREHIKYDVNIADSDLDSFE